MSKKSTEKLTAIFIPRYAKNRAIEQSTGKYICFLDADDQMLPRRLVAQLRAAEDNPAALIGSRFHREPSDSTIRYARWANELPAHTLEKQVAWKNPYDDVTLSKFVWL